MNIEWIGWLGILLINFAAIPQLIKIWKHKRTAGISMLKYALVAAGLCCFVVYSFIKKDMIFFADSSIAVLLNISILVSCYLHRKWGYD